ncbi:hypothetical protein [Thalassoroseus pseudoceratinae]|uniref:hypothetical protein n=1 Tax=Thalassoroseus pseudoceratinae TaxID=2713176 RepID=UPI00141E7359|nr:hypothetical protein [Thalassoroseus pseudoceratinae]
MQLNTEELAVALSSQSEEDLNAILDTRDAGSFDSEWCRVNELVGGNERHPEAKAIFIQFSNSTRQHDIVSYIADDIDLLFRAEHRGISSPFLDYLRSCYAKNTVPSKWEGI